VIASVLPALQDPRGDSLSNPQWLGETVVRGGPGGRVLVGIDGLDGTPLPAGLYLVVSVNEGVRRYPVGELRQWTAVFEFDEHRVVHLLYAIEGNQGRPGSMGAAVLQLTEAATILERWTPLAGPSRGMGPMPTASANPPCPFNSPSWWCGMSVGIAPYTPGQPWNSGGFQSHPGTTASDPVTIDFGAEITSFTIAVYDPDFDGNEVVAYNAKGRRLASAGVPSDGTPQRLTIEPISLAADGIRRIVLVPAPADYVAYADATFVRAPCPPTGDPILDTQAVRDSFLSALAASRPNPDGTGKKEIGHYIWQNTVDGSYGTTPINDPAATDCGFTVPAGTPAIPPGTHAVAVFHTHPSYSGEPLYDCRDAPPGEVVWASRNPKAGGGSPEDWDGATRSGAPQYTIDLDKNVARLDPDVPPDQRRYNANRWRMSSSSDCLEKAS
jgi:hypothetical protein